MDGTVLNEAETSARQGHQVMVHSIQVKTLQVRHIPCRMEREDLPLAVLRHLGAISKAAQDHATMRGAFAFANDDGFFRKFLYLNTQGAKRCNVIRRLSVPLTSR